MSACRDQEELLTLHAAGALEPEDEARVRAHLASCAACRAELDAQREVLGFVALPPPSAREEALLAALPRTTADAWLSTQLRQAARMRTAGALMAAAAVVLLALGPMVQRRVAPSTSPTEEELSTQPGEETLSELEQWALSDPLAEALDPAESQSEELDDTDEPSDSELDAFLSYPDPGESL
jgi:anti-sigma factor RsiW